MKLKGVGLDLIGPARPVWTIVATGRRAQKWGFFPEPGRFVPYDQYLEEN